VRLHVVVDEGHLIADGDSNLARVHTGWQNRDGWDDGCRWGGRRRRGRLRRGLPRTRG
jgi:hypothetical protein